VAASRTRFCWVFIHHREIDLAPVPRRSRPSPVVRYTSPGVGVGVGDGSGRSRTSRTRFLFGFSSIIENSFGITSAVRPSPSPVPVARRPSSVVRRPSRRPLHSPESGRSR
jgi:hypothetical protein